MNRCIIKTFFEKHFRRVVLQFSKIISVKKLKVSKIPLRVNKIAAETTRVRHDKELNTFECFLSVKTLRSFMSWDTHALASWYYQQTCDGEIQVIFYRTFSGCKLGLMVCSVFNCYEKKKTQRLRFQFGCDNQELTLHAHRHYDRHVLPVNHWRFLFIYSLFFSFISLFYYFQFIF